MKIGELAERSGQTQSKIRFYERIGLLKMVERRSNGYRTYPPEALAVLEMINTAQQAGFNLDQIRTLVPSDLEHWEHDKLLSILQTKVEEIDALERQLKTSKSRIRKLIAEIKAKPDDIDCLANAQRVMKSMVPGFGELKARS